MSAMRDMRKSYNAKPPTADTVAIFSMIVGAALGATVVLFVQGLS